MLTGGFDMDAPQADRYQPTWATARKDIVGTGLGASRVWFTMAEGIVTEVYYYRIDIPHIRDLGFIVADGRDFWAELRRLDNYSVALAHDCTPAVTVTHHHERFTLRLRVCPHQDRDVLLVDYELEGQAELRPYVLGSPRLGSDADNNVGEATCYNGRRVLWAEQGPFGLALLAAAPGVPDAFGRISAGCAGASDGWQDFYRNRRMTWEYDRAGPGEIALMGELPRRGTLALGFAASKESAATLAAAALVEDFDHVWRDQVAAWSAWADTLKEPRIPAILKPTFARSAMVLKTHGDRTFRGAMVASLAVPWGETSGSRGGYHLVWARDLVESAGALIAIEAWHDARDVLRYLIATQQDDGHWLQNQWLGGKPFWQGVQLDETAFPVLLAGMLAAHRQLGGIPVGDMVRRALAFLVTHGPVSAQDRWEEDAGINAFTLAVMIAALVEGAQFLDEPDRGFALMIADTWNARTEDWTWVEGTALAERLGVEGYYLRAAPGEVLIQEGAKADELLIKNRTYDNHLRADEQVATDFLQLVRFGLRQPDDPRVLETLKLVDELLRTDTPAGPVWHRYNNDGYGEHRDGRPFDGAGHGRGWPLLTGERGHYALCAGEDPLPYLKTMAAMAGPGGMIPEQVWDTDPIPEHRLYPGRPTGSAMPLAWAHSEFVKLVVSRACREPCDRPQRTWERYHGERPTIDWRIWSLHCQPRGVPSGYALRLALPAPALIHWSTDGWAHSVDTRTRPTGLGSHSADLPAADLPSGGTLVMTFRWEGDGRWAGRDYRVAIGP